jgi:hypothetical protein
MIWQTPGFEEINMSAEIGSYQEDDGGGHFPIAVPGSETNACEPVGAPKATARPAPVEQAV